MSVRFMAAVWKLEMRATNKIVLLKLADCCDDAGSNAYPSVETMAAECGLDERTVQRSLKWLQLNRYLEVHRPATRNFPASYRLVINRGGTQSPLTPARGDTEYREGRQPVARGVTLSTERGGRVSPDPSIDPSKEPSERSEAAAASGVARDIPTSDSIWQSVVEILRQQLNPHAFASYFAELWLERLQSGKAVIASASEVTLHYQRRSGVKTLERALEQVLDRSITVQFVCIPRKSA